VGRGKEQSYIYTRYGNPTAAIAEQKSPRSKGAEAAVCTASGMAAIPARCRRVKCGDELIPPRSFMANVSLCAMCWRLESVHQ